MEAARRAVGVLTMSFWKSNLSLLQGENVLWERGAARSIGKATVGGTLYVTTARVLFAPNKLNVRRRPVWETERHNVVSVTDESPRLEAFSGGVRRRLRLVVSGADDQLFVVNRIEQAIEELRPLLED